MYACVNVYYMCMKRRRGEVRVMETIFADRPSNPYISSFYLFLSQCTYIQHAYIYIYIYTSPSFQLF